jgi:hypothetical protein
MGGVVGLNYAALESVARIMEIENLKLIFGEIQAMEYAVLPIFNEKTSK